MTDAAGAAAAAGATGGTAAGAGGGATTPWVDAFDPETKGYFQNKGLDKKTVTEALTEVSRMHREAEKLIGAPANEMIRLPKDPNAPEWKNVWNRLGTPLDPKDYDFTGLKRAGDKPVDDALLDTIRKTVATANVTKDKAPEVGKAIIDYLDKADAARAADDAAKLAVSRKALKDNWGANEAANKFVAQQAAKALGVKPETIDALSNNVGYAEIMEMFRLIGTKIGEDKFIQSPGGGGTGGAMTKDQALAQREALKKDTAWVNRYAAGSAEEQRQMQALNMIISGVAA